MKQGEVERQAADLKELAESKEELNEVCAVLCSVLRSCVLWLKKLTTAM